jgi:hypothetical protein
MKKPKVFAKLDQRYNVPGYRDAKDFGVLHGAAVGLKIRDRRTVLEEFEAAETAAFIAAHPEYYPSAFNLGLIRAWLAIYDVPFSEWNLTICVNDLKEDGLLEPPPPTAAPELDASRGVLQVRSDALLEYQTPSDEQKILEKLRDDSALNDSQRKSRLRRLALLAGAQRRANAAPRRPDDRDPSIGI